MAIESAVKAGDSPRSASGPAPVRGGILETALHADDLAGNSLELATPNMGSHRAGTAVAF